MELPDLDWCAASVGDNYNKLSAEIARAEGRLKALKALDLANQKLCDWEHQRRDDRNPPGRCMKCGAQW